jgi:hypothetical protein
MTVIMMLQTNASRTLSWTHEQSFQENSQMCSQQSASTPAGTGGMVVRAVLPLPLRTLGSSSNTCCIGITRAHMLHWHHQRFKQRFKQQHMLHWHHICCIGNALASLQQMIYAAEGHPCATLLHSSHTALLNHRSSSSIGRSGPAA